jgi:hypothetical protein
MTSPVQPSPSNLQPLSSIFRSPFSISHSPSSILRFVRRYIPWAAIDALIVAASLLLA